MAVNESIYGAKNLWLKADTYTDGVSRDDMFLQPNFLGEETTDVENSYIKKGVETGKLKLNRAIDMTPVFCGMGTESPLSNIDNYDFSRTATPEIRSRDYTSVFNWSFGRSLQSDVYALNIKTKEMMFAPSNDFTSIRFNGAYQGVRPIVNTPIKNAVLYPYVKVCNGLNVSSQEKIYSLEDYISDENTYKEDYPYITHVFFTIYTNKSATPISETHSRGIWVNDNYKNIVEFNSNKVYENKTISNKTFSDSYQYHYSFCNFAGSTYGITFIGCLNSSQRYHQTSYENQNEYVIRFTNNMKVTWCKDTAQYPFYMIGYMEYDKGFEEYVRKALACFGMFFTFNLDTALHGALDDELMYCGTIENGITHGNYTHGAKNKEQSQWSWKSSNDSTYVPTTPIPAGDLKSNRNNLSGVISGGKMYKVDSLGIDSLLNALCGAMTGDIVSDEDRYKMSLNFGDKSPLDYVTSFRFCPFALTGGTPTNTITLFNKPLTTTSPIFAPINTTLKRVTVSTNVPRLHNDFRDYPPYTTLQLYVPFCDTIELNPSEWYGSQLILDYFFNLSTGDVTCAVKNNDLDFAVVTGTFLYDIPLTAENNNAYRIAISSLNIDSKYNDINTLISQVNSGANVISNAVTGNVGGMLSGFTSMINNSINHAETREKLELQYQATKPNLCKSGSANATNNFMLDFDAKLIYKYRDFDMDFANYGNTVGYACLKNGSLAGCSNLTKMTNTKIDVSLPQDIINAMTNALNTGIIM